MTEELGKISRDFFNEHILPKLGYERNEILTPPKSGVDIGIVRLGNNRVMAITTDPFSVHPALGWERASWFAYHIIASDLCTSGLPPEYMSVDLNLPIEITDAEIDVMWSTVHKEALKYGTAIVTGHTARYEGTNYPMIGSATMIGMGQDDAYVTSAMSQAGDSVIVTKSIAIEAAAIFATSFPEHVEKNLGTDLLKKGQDLFYRMSTVDESIEASKFGLRDKGITSMHDATEGGILGALYEVADASGNGIMIKKDSLPLYSEVKEITNLFGMDPYHSISEGALVITVKSERAEKFVKRLNSIGVDSAIVGEIKEKKFGKKILEKGETNELLPPRHDDYWPAMKRAMERNLK